MFLQIEHSIIMNRKASLNESIHRFDMFQGQLKPKFSYENKAENLVDSNFTIGKNIHIQLVDVERKIKRFQVRENITGIELKQYIYANISDELTQEQMKLKYQRAYIIDSEELSKMKRKNENIIKIIQQKVNLHELKRIGSLTVDGNGVDEIECEKGLAIMACGHKIGQNGMSRLMAFLVSQKRYQIRCPFNQNQTGGSKCNQIWDPKACIDAAILTKSQANHFKNNLSQNWTKAFTKACPNNCGFSITKERIKENKVQCTACGYGFYCWICNLKWQSKGKMQCGNQQCNSVNIFLASGQTKMFPLKVNGVEKNFKVPATRVCPTCRTIIQHEVGCKHMECTNCNEEFCFVCLKMAKDYSGSYPCGGYSDYCGMVAGPQTFEEDEEEENDYILRHSVGENEGQQYGQVHHQRFNYSQGSIATENQEMILEDEISDSNQSRYLIPQNNASELNESSFLSYDES